ncbi:3-oxoacyl-ACP synthase III family protein [Streptomyces sp. NPDC058576]|uniref:3-oxoacyl-ACP synthase III family protein n=1 Tax=Streptomyces sp. NPDC058576 TaxID=3346547 RepID=UPI0036629310
MSSSIGTQRAEGAVGILGLGAYIPSQVITNEELAGPASVTEEWILAKTGIHTRRRAKPDEATSDLAGYAARAALENAGLRAADISLIVGATSTPDMLGPAIACQVADHIGCPITTAAFDVHAACSGFLTAMTTAEKFLLGTGGHALVIGADTYTRFLDPADRRTVVLWGDGAGAAVLGPTSGTRRILASKLLSDGADFDVATIPAGGSRLPASKETLEAGQHFVSMDGRRVSSIVSERLPGLVEEFLKEQGVAKEDVDHLVTHQPNANLVQNLKGMLGVDNARVHATAPKYGNTGSASVPVTLEEAARDGGMKPGDTVLLVAFGAGFTFAFTLLHW